LDWWGLFFAERLSYSELWGTPRGGLTTGQKAELTAAYEEWDRQRKAYEAWEKEHDPKDPDDAHFDMRGYLEKRCREIEEGT